MAWPPQNPDLPPFENLWDVLEQALHSGPILPSEIQAPGEKLKQHWMDINLFSMSKHLYHSKSKLKAVQYIRVCDLFFWPCSVNA